MSGTTDAGQDGADPRGTEQPDTEQPNTEQPSVEELEAHIERTRQELGETVDALSAKLDVKTRVRQQVASSTQQARESMTDQDGSLKPVVPIAGVSAALLVVGGLAFSVLRRRRRRDRSVLGRRR